MSTDSALHLSYNDGDQAGYTRRRTSKGWTYLNDRGKPIRAKHVIARLDALALPPAYRDAWFARDQHAHIQATGIDDKGRKQYRYHADFIAHREAAKYAGCTAFGAALPAIRAQVEADLARRDPSRDRVIAAIVRLLDVGSLRIGNAAYAKANRSYGATTLRTRHATIKGSTLKLDYVGKSGKTHRISIADARLVRLVRQCQDIDGPSLFQYLDRDGVPHPISSADVNAYLAHHGGNFTAKHFRTWSASVIAFDYLTTVKSTPRLKDMLALVAAKLGNTPAIARKSYVHPALIDATHDDSFEAIRLPRRSRYLSRAERGLIAWLDAERP